ncbi:hypothetical protein M440DRAFT_1406133 [Trichoderma longibrachiatum ATCC 18648]|uniref:Uncharacterized protein n=1 Tax=Trichoderma longibrachiatum ATCC 18648 TaxID=983965 RepID=A0A2T4BRD4_TRILO|nr:hypothetical protein M440DRAFT_1406133 [Trichoderma longibrachiatum ATCC 18648]
MITAVCPQSAGLVLRQPGGGLRDACQRQCLFLCSYIDAAPSQFVPPYDSTSIYGRRLNPRVAILDLLKQVRTQSVSAWHL